VHHHKKLPTSKDRIEKQRMGKQILNTKTGELEVKQQVVEFEEHKRNKSARETMRPRNPSARKRQQQMG
jgi:hypothetical protein